LAAVGVGLLIALFFVGRSIWRQLRYNPDLFVWFTQPDQRPGLGTPSNPQPCSGAPFILPSPGFIGLVWNDIRYPYSPVHRHSGLDIFGDGQVGQIPVYAVYDGYLTRLSNWKSAVIIQHPQDPLDPSRQIWTYYAHMAADNGKSFIVDTFPPGSAKVPVKQGDLLGYQGVYNGGNGRVGLHLHFSVVQDDGKGNFLNETEIGNTLDPSPYLGMRLNYACADDAPSCAADVTCP